jgi:hypothetical protein
LTVAVRYGSWNALDDFKRYVTKVHSRFGINIWITEIGITAASYPSTQQVKNFLMQSFTWLDSQYYVERASWFGEHTPWRRSEITTFRIYASSGFRFRSFFFFGLELYVNVSSLV